MHAPRQRYELTAEDRRRGLLVLLSTTFLSWGGFFAVVPLIAVHFVDDLGWTASSVGLILALRQFSQQGSTTLCGGFADRFGAKWLIAAGMGVRVFGFGIMAFADTFPILLLSALVTGISGGLFDSPKAAAIATLTTDDNRRRFYSLAGVISGVGVAIGTQAGALLIKTDFTFVSLVGAGVFLVAFILVVLFLPPVDVATGSHGLLQGFGLVLRDRPFVRYTALMMGYWFMSTQLSLTLALAAADIAGTDSAVSWIYGINSLATVVLGYPLPRLLERRMHPFPMLILGIALTALGLGCVALASNLATLFTCVLVMSIGTVIMRPGEQTITAGLASPVARGSYFGIAALSLAFGGGLGNFLGGMIYDYGNNHGIPDLPWLTFAAVGTLSVIGLTRMAETVKARASAPATAAKTV